MHTCEDTAVSYFMFKVGNTAKGIARKGWLMYLAITVSSGAALISFPDHLLQNSLGTTLEREHME